MIFFGNVGIKKVMPRNRFSEISGFLHFHDSSLEVARGDPGYDRLFKVRPVLTYVRSKCETNFSPTKNISVDEGMVPFRGRLSFRQYMPAKPTKYSIKVWMAADSSNGYVLNFDVYLGKEAGNRRIHGLGYDVVTKMITPYMNKNHHVYFDNFFSSVRLLEHLRVQKTFACATIQAANCGVFLYRFKHPSAAKLRIFLLGRETPESTSPQKSRVGKGNVFAAKG